MLFKHFFKSYGSSKYVSKSEIGKSSSPKLGNDRIEIQCNLSFNTLICVQKLFKVWDFQIHSRSPGTAGS